MAIYTIIFTDGSKKEYRLSQVEEKELRTSSKSDQQTLTFGSVEIEKASILHQTYNDSVCHHCFSDQIECQDASSDSEGKIVGTWLCVECQGTFETRY